MALVMSGLSGSLRWGYHQAATVSRWTVTVSGASGAGSLEAVVVAADPFQVTQAPLVFRVERPQSVWTWPVQSLTLTGDRLHATLGPQQ